MKWITAWWVDHLREQGVKLETGSRTVLDIRTIDLSNRVTVKYEDGSKSAFYYATVYERDDAFLVVTEHCGFHEIEKGGVTVKKRPMFSKKKLKKVKASPELARAFKVLLPKEKE